ncbi:MAG TPA: phosphoribosylglycinamide formyltransferase [Gemmatimonadales bacterium]|nr:phosphoribosylglycinamide formyltransferase [Gemmatimonadales bacterium]
MSCRVAVCVSGGGSNLQALLDALQGEAPARVVLVLSNRPDAGGLDRARRAGVPAEVLADPADTTDWITRLGRRDVDFVVLAGYLKLVPPGVIAKYRGRMINIHPALLPAFGGPGMYGRRVHEAVLRSGATESGATVHLVDEEFDRGEVLAQRRVPVLPGDTPDSLAARVLEAEHRLLPAVVLAAARAGRPVPLTGTAPPAGPE